MNALKEQKNRISIRVFMISLIFMTVLLSTSVSAFAENKSFTEVGPHWNDRYAVALYGIRHDQYVNHDGEATGPAGLTFGPATGKKHLETYRMTLFIQLFQKMKLEC